MELYNEVKATSTQQQGLEKYETILEQYRAQFGEKLQTILNEKDPKVMLGFWINFSAYGVGMTEPVEHWVRRAGEKCKQLGYEELGEQLRKHAIHEADHHLMMIEDAKRLMNMWNNQYSPTLNSETILNRSIPDAVLNYQDLHEDYINSDSPYCQIAIEYEVESLSAGYGTQILDHTFNVLGQEIEASLSFLVDHSKIDVAHTQYNRKAIAAFISAFPHTIDNLINAGILSLKIYGDFLMECYQKAKDGEF